MTATDDRERAWAAARTVALVADLIDDATVLGARVVSGTGGAILVDCGVDVPGSWEAGRRIAAIAHAGLMEARLGATEVGGIPLVQFLADSWLPPLSAYGYQVSFALDEVDASVRVSGPIRARTHAVGGPAPASGRGLDPWGVAVVESASLPSRAAIAALADRASLRPEKLLLVVAPANSLAGVTQVAGRLNESVLYTLAESLRRDPARVVAMLGSVPIAPCAAAAAPVVTQDDMIHYAGRVTMVVEPGWDLETVAEGLTFASSPACGRLFSELLAEAGGVFERVPGLADLNKVAQVALVDRQTGRVVSRGATNERILAEGLTRTGGNRGT